MQPATFRHSNVFLVGPMGVGKTTIGKMLARELGLEFVDSDHEIEERAGADIGWIFDVEGEEGFRQRESRVIDDLTKQRGMLIATGGGAILRDENRRHLQSRGTVIFLDTALETQLNRLSKDKKRPLLQSGDHRRILTALKAKRDPLYNAVSDLRVVVGENNSRKVVDRIKYLLHEQMPGGA